MTRSLGGALTGALMLTLVACGGAADSEPTASRRAAGGKADQVAPVRLVYADTYNSGCSSCIAGRVYIEVEDLAYEKSVTVAYRAASGSWTESDARHLESVSGNREIWIAEIFGTDTEFAIRYRVGGAEYWDNNGQKNYKLKADVLSGSGFQTTVAPLGPDRDIAIVKAEPLTDAAQITLHLRNAAFDKDVHLVYSDDSWKTTKIVPASYARSLGGDTERWTAAIPTSNVGLVEFAAVVKMNNVESWDNGYGDNFNCARVANHLIQGWRCHGPTIGDGLLHP